MRAQDLKSRVANLRKIASCLPTVEVVNLLELYARDMCSDAERVGRGEAARSAYNRIATFQ
ncbi:MAG: hypothetical protein JWO65_1031 [Sphingomonas bacterium]|jgi:hypothetical protein|nr:hypothetical protein [Sphingomonas bacterium]